MGEQINRLELTWIGKYDDIEVEPRVLIEDNEKSYGDLETENMLIHGDNLLALKALEAEFSKKIKCIYIDPPYNTGSAFEHYDDNLEHSIWLSLMKKRLHILKKLLTEDGCIAVQIGYDEMAYLKVLMDEVFGRNRCIGQIAVRMSHSAGMKRKAMDKRMIKNTEYILIYYNEIQPEITPLYEICNEFPVNYYYYIEKFPEDNNGIGNYKNLIDILYENFRGEFEKNKLKKRNTSIKVAFENSNNIRKFIMDNRNRIVRKDSNTPKINKEDLKSLKTDEFIRMNISNEEYFIGVNANKNIYQIYSLEDKVKEVDTFDENGDIVKSYSITNLIGDWWDNFYKDMSRVDVEGGVKLKTSKKPERLIKWILTALSRENDYVLDSFLGSGTTAAVAHKMNRKWIGIELGDHCYSLCEKRLKSVIDGCDQTGISKSVGWTGGGGFKFYELAPSLLKEDKFGNLVIDQRYNKEMLVMALCKQEGFKYSPDKEVFWKQGYSYEKDYIFVTSNFISPEYLDTLYNDMKNDESLLICCKAYHPCCIDKYENINIKKIPQSLFGKFEYGKDNYNLNVIESNDIEGFNEDADDNKGELAYE